MTSEFNNGELLTLRTLTNDVAADPMSVEHCCVELESAEHGLRRIIYRTEDPVRLWIRICQQFYSDRQLGDRLVVRSEAYWRGETICDSLLIHRWDATVLEQNPFSLRVECSECGGFYRSGQLYPRCPHCKERLKT